MAIAPTRQSPEDMAAAVDGIAANRLGPNPATAPNPANPANVGQPNVPPPPVAEPKDSAQDAANTAAAPVTEDDKAKAESVEYEVAVTIGDTPYTKKQIEGTMSRYKALNHRNAQLKPVMSVIEEYMRSNPNRTVQDIATDLASIAKGGAASPTLGDPNTPSNPQVNVSEVQSNSNEDVSAALKEWAKKNALDDLPPGIENLLAMNDTSNAVNGRMDNMEGVLRQIIPMLQGGMDAMKQNSQDVSAQADQNRMNSIAVNIDRAQNALRIPDDQAPQFETWMQMIGLTLDDFLDADDAYKYMQEFDGHLKSNQFDQLKAMTEKRLAYTGGLGSTPTAQGAPAPAAEGDRLGQMAQKIMSSRNQSL